MLQLKEVVALFIDKLYENILLKKFNIKKGI